jgi:hypothetical protein
MAEFYEICQAADGRLLFQGARGRDGLHLDLLPRDQRRLYALPPLYATLKSGKHLESQAKDAAELLAGGRAAIPRAVRAALHARSALRTMHCDARRRP